MSRAFVKEDSAGDNAGALPDRAIPAHPNYVTASGLARLQAQVRDLTTCCEALKRTAAEDGVVQDRQRALERDLRYFRAQLERAELVDVAASPHDRVHFGATVTVSELGELGKGGSLQRRICIVGDDEADAAAGDISWASPLARALIGARVGECVIWQRPAGAAEIEILAVEYP